MFPDILEENHNVILEFNINLVAFTYYFKNTISVLYCSKS